MDIETRRLRQTAAEAGKIRFTNGKPCKHGHMAERYTSTGACTACTNRPFKVARSAFSKQLVPYTNSHLWTANGLCKAERIRLRAYLQRCIFIFIRDHANHEDGSRFTPDTELLEGMKEIESRLQYLTVEDLRNTD